MPTYQYACTECGHAFEQFQAFTDDALTECPACGGRLRKLFGSVGVVFKGSGFYRTDSREKPKDPSGATDKGEAASTDGGKDSGAPGSDKKAPAAPNGSGKTGSSSKPEKTAASSGSSGSAGKAGSAA